MHGTLLLMFLITKTSSDCNKLISLNRKINSNQTKHILVENEFKKLPTFDSIYLETKSFRRG